MIVLKLVFRFLIFLVLTITSQIGGIIYLLHFPIFKVVNQRALNRFQKHLLGVVIFLSMYLISIFIIVPPIAKIFGRVQLPAFEKNSIQPYSMVSVLLNRNYVTKDLNVTLNQVASQFINSYPNLVITYLDANFPFWDGFPLIPHVSHSDGKKIDISFYYKSNKDNKPIYKRPSFLGYGYVEGPRKTEVNTPAECSRNGYWQYNLISKLPWINENPDIKFDSEKTKKLILLFANQSSVSKIFIEPHLKSRLKLNNSKIRFHGCHAVRHDDHIHIQIK
jgi:hypothetical protein